MLEYMVFEQKQKSLLKGRMKAEDLQEDPE